MHISQTKAKIVAEKEDENQAFIWIMDKCLLQEEVGASDAEGQGNAILPFRSHVKLIPEEGPTLDLMTSLEGGIQTGTKIERTK